jgi:hypothetical protein
VTKAFHGRHEVLHHGRLVRAPLVDEFGSLVWQAARATLQLPSDVVDEPSLNNWVRAHSERRAQRRDRQQGRP